VIFYFVVSSFIIWTEGGMWFDSCPGHHNWEEEYEKKSYITEKMMTYKKYSMYIGMNSKTSGRDNSIIMLMLT